MTYGITSAKQANVELEDFRNKQYKQLLTEMQENLDDALKRGEEYFNATIPVWCKEDMIAYLRQMGYEVVEDGGEDYSIVFGKKKLENLRERSRQKEEKKKRETIGCIIVILIYLAILGLVYVGFGGSGVATFVALTILFIIGTASC